MSFNSATLAVKSDDDYPWHHDKEFLQWLYVEKEYSTKEVGDIVGRSEKTVCHFMNKQGIPRRSGSDKITKNFRNHMSKRLTGKPTWNAGMAGNYQKWAKYGKEAPGYKGGVSKLGNRGYIKIFLPEHPNPDANGYVFEHRLVCEKALGRYLRDDEIVHHRDSDPTNNSLSNLFIFEGHSTHRHFHLAKARDVSLTEEEFCRGEDFVCL